MSVCRFLAACLHYHIYSDIHVTLGGALLLCTTGRICNRCTGRVSSLWQHTRLMRNVSEYNCTRCKAGSFCLKSTQALAAKSHRAALSHVRLCRKRLGQGFRPKHREFILTTKGDLGNLKDCYLKTCINCTFLTDCSVAFLSICFLRLKRSEVNRNMQPVCIAHRNVSLPCHLVTTRQKAEVITVQSRRRSTPRS